MSKVVKVTLAEELASQIFVEVVTAERLPPGGTPLEGRGDAAPVDRRQLTHDALKDAQVFCETLCAERGDHDFDLVRWLEGNRPAQRGHGSGAPIGLYVCLRCGRQEERSQ